MSYVDLMSISTEFLSTLLSNRTLSEMHFSIVELLNLIDGQAVHLFWHALNDLPESLVVLHGLGDGRVIVLGVDGRVAAHASNPKMQKNGLNLLFALFSLLTLK